MKLPRLKIGVAIFLCVQLSFPAYGAESVKARGTFGIGAVFGDPTGITGKLWLHGNKAIDGLAAWSFRDFFFVHSHYLFHYREPLDGRWIVLYLGPGAYSRFGKGRNRLGISGNFGIAYPIDQFEIFLELSPKVSIISETDGDFTGGIGFRYFFSK